METAKALDRWWKSNASRLKWFLSVFLLIGFALACYAGVVQMRNATQKQEIQDAMQGGGWAPNIEAELGECKSEVDGLNERLQTQTNIHQESIGQIKSLQQAVDRTEHECQQKLEKVQKSPPKNKMEQKLSRVTEELKKQSREALATLYGENTKIIVDMQLSLGKISIQMAPSSLMPYTTKWFTDLVRRGYWDGCGFIRAAGHVLQANCNPKKSEKPEYPSIAFQEYSERYTHKIHTVGIAGFPGGPDWYINIVDNVRNHGPGGQDPVEANPCFGEVISGFDVVDLIKKQPHEPSGFNGIYSPVIIQKATIRTVPA